MTCDNFPTLTRSAAGAFLTLALPLAVRAQSAGAGSNDSTRIVAMADHAMSGPMDTITMRHMKLTPTRAPTHADSVRAINVAAELKRAIAKYQDTAVAVADGFKMFAPQIKNQAVFHFTKTS